MSWKEKWEGIQTHLLAAETAAKVSREAANQIVEMLNEGVDISVANRLISEHWGDTAMARSLRTRLFSAFPDENGRVLRNAPLTQDDLDRFRGEYSEVVTYFDAIHAYILEGVGELTNRLNKADPSDEVAFGTYNSFRRNAMRYTSYVDDGFYQVREFLEKGEITSWSDLVRLLPIESIDNGDYLFIDEFVKRLSEIQQHYIGRELEIEAQDRYSICDIEWVLLKAVSHIKIPMLFAEYLNGLLSKEDV